MGEAAKRKVAIAKLLETTRSRDLHRAHLPTAVALVEDAVRRKLVELGETHLVRNRAAWEPSEGVLTCDLVWGWIVEAIGLQTWSNKAEVRQWCRLHYGPCGYCPTFGALPRCSNPKCGRPRDVKARRLEDIERMLREREGLEAGRSMCPSYYAEVS
jgi:hypothetical protein